MISYTRSSMSFYDKHRLRNGAIFNPGWCGTCGIPRESLKKIVSDEIDKLKDENHTWIIAEDTIFWWCGEEQCNPSNANERHCYVKKYEADGTHYFRIDIPEGIERNEELIRKDLENITWSHYCTDFINDEVGYKWCGSDQCLKTPKEEIY